MGLIIKTCLLKKFTFKHTFFHNWYLMIEYLINPKKGIIHKKNMYYMTFKFIHVLTTTSHLLCTNLASNFKQNYVLLRRCYWETLITTISDMTESIHAIGPYRSCTMVHCYEYKCISIHIHLSLFIYLSIYTWTYVCVYVHKSFHLFLHN